MKLREKIGRFLKVFRAMSGKTQKELADKLGVSVSTYNTIESATADFRISFLEKLQDVLGVTISEVLNFDDSLLSRSGKMKRAG